MTMIASAEYYRRIRRAQKEYERARDFVEDIVLSFNRELKREAERLELIAFKVEGTSSKTDTSLNKMESAERRIASIEEQLGVLREHAAQTTLQTTQDNIKSSSVLEGLELKIKDVEFNQDSLRTKILSIEEQIQRIQASPTEVKVETPVPLMPIKRDKALAALTDTEIAVLEMLAREGAKTAPEIKERVHLSREHTARLMKKLYEEGYVEREAGKIPFRYNIKKEMEKLMQRVE
ncbi:MAG: MarR family transcriptional regulator [Candidatus Bathyarchaeota archaeon]|nr:MarR family transcriptional regulator [Candidatus Bathyarchaeota archaeon]